MAANPQQTHWTVEEYLAMEEASEIKHEYIDGEIFAMAGASENHDLIVGNIFANLHLQLRSNPCRPHTSDMRVHVVNRRYVYPDITVVCDPPEFSEDRPPSLLNPLLIIEVLSESTTERDRGEKAFFYRATESIQAYLLVEQNRPHIEQYVRQEDGSWRFTEISNLEGNIHLPTIDCTLQLTEVYERVEFTAEGEESREE